VTDRRVSDFRNFISWQVAVFWSVPKTVPSVSDGQFSRYFDESIADFSIFFFFWLLPINHLGILTAVSRWIFPTLCRGNHGKFFRYFVGRLVVIYQLFCCTSRSELSQYFISRLMVKCLDISLVVHNEFSRQYFGRFTVNYFDIMLSVSLSVISLFCPLFWKRNSAFQVSATLLAKIAALINRNIWRKYRAENRA
jgi:hypothetical protein